MSKYRVIGSSKYYRNKYMDFIFLKNNFYYKDNGGERCIKWCWNVCCNVVIG